MTHKKFQPYSVPYCLHPYITSENWLITYPRDPYNLMTLTPYPVVSQREARTMPVGLWRHVMLVHTEQRHLLEPAQHPGQGTRRSTVSGIWGSAGLKQVNSVTCSHLRISLGRRQLCSDIPGGDLIASIDYTDLYTRVWN